MAVTVRDVQPADAAAVAGLLGELGYPSTAQDVTRRLTMWLDQPHSRVLLATDGARVAGSLSLHAIPCLERDGRWARIESLVVTAAARGTGAGRMLVDAAEKLALAWDCDGIEVTSARHRAGAHAFYRRLGFADLCDRSGRFWKAL